MWQSLLVANIKADVYHCPQLSVSSAKLFDCFFGVEPLSSSTCASAGAFVKWDLCIASACTSAIAIADWASASSA